MKNTKKPHLILRHLWLGNTSAAWVFPGGCSQASEAMIITKGDALKHNNITLWYVITGLGAAVWILSLIYNDLKYFLCNKSWPPQTFFFINSVTKCSLLWTKIKYLQQKTAKEMLSDFFLGILRVSRVTLFVRSFSKKCAVVALGCPGVQLTLVALS